MSEFNQIFNRLAYLHRNKPEHFQIYAEAEGKCRNCTSTVTTAVRELPNEGLQVLCDSCFRITKDCKRLNMTPEVYKIEREQMIKEIAERLIGNMISSKRINEKDITRNTSIYSMFLRGRSHAHIASTFGLSRERVRQIVKRFNHL